MRDLFGHETTPEILEPEGQDAELCRAWADFATLWTSRDDEAFTSDRGFFYLELEKRAHKFLNLRPVTLSGIKAKLIMTLCSSVDCGPFLRHYVEGKPLPKLMTFREPAMSQVYDAIVAIERLQTVEREGS